MKASNGWEYVGYGQWREPSDPHGVCKWSDVGGHYDKQVYYAATTMVEGINWNVEKIIPEIEEAKKELGIRYLSDIGYAGPDDWNKEEDGNYHNGEFCLGETSDVMIISHVDMCFQPDKFLLNRIEMEIGPISKAIEITPINVDEPYTFEHGDYKLEIDDDIIVMSWPNGNVTLPIPGGTDIYTVMGEIFLNAISMVKQHEPVPENKIAAALDHAAHQVHKGFFRY